MMRVGWEPAGQYHQGKEWFVYTPTHGRHGPFATEREARQWRIETWFATVWLPTIVITFFLVVLLVWVK